MTHNQDCNVKSKIFNELTKIPKGKVTTYGVIARKLGINPRQVGRILHTNIDTVKYPCHRVVYSDGRLTNGYAFGGLRGQEKRLKSEGVGFSNEKISKDFILQKLDFEV